MNKFEQVSEAKKIYEAAVQAVEKNDIVAVLTPLFEQYPQVLSVRWRQYTPYFNDGDPCRFRVGDCHFKFHDTEEEAGDYEDGFESYSENLEKKKAMNAFESALCIDQDIMERVFGDHAEVTVDRDGVSIDEYDHS